MIREIKEETSLVIEKRKIGQLDSKTTISVWNYDNKEVTLEEKGDCAGENKSKLS